MRSAEGGERSAESQSWIGELANPRGFSPSRQVSLELARLFVGPGSRDWGLGILEFWMRGKLDFVFQKSHHLSPPAAVWLSALGPPLSAFPG